MTIQDHNTIHPNVIQDVSTEAPGIVAGELAAEDEGLLSNDALKTHTYGSVSTPETTHYEIDDPNGGYALPKTQLYTVVSQFIHGIFLSSFGWNRGYYIINFNCF